jgi:hypothetical protein
MLRDDYFQHYVFRYKHIFGRNLAKQLRHFVTKKCLT